jgi:hypothetical protein
LSAKLGIELAPARIPFEDGSRVEVDAMSEDPPLIAEIWAHQGPPKGAQRNKVLTDVLKLAYVADSLGVAYRKIICFTDPEAREPFVGRSWYAGALRHYDVETVVVDISDASANGSSRPRPANSAEPSSSP